MTSILIKRLRKKTKRKSQWKTEAEAGRGKEGFFLVAFAECGVAGGLTSDIWLPEL